MLEIAAFISFASLILVWAFAPSVTRETSKAETAPAAQREALA
jgi:hypothetical protein